MFYELNKPFYVKTPKGDALCWAMIDYGPEMDLLFVTWQEETGESWTWPSYDVKIFKNVSLGRDFNGGPTDRHKQK